MHKASPKGPKPKDNSRLKRQVRERDAAIKAIDQLLRKLRAMNYADVVDSVRTAYEQTPVNEAEVLYLPAQFSLEVNKARTALRQCESPSHTVNSEVDTMFPQSVCLFELTMPFRSVTFRPPSERRTRVQWSLLTRLGDIRML